MWHCFSTSVSTAWQHSRHIPSTPASNGCCYYQIWIVFLSTVLTASDVTALLLIVFWGSQERSFYQRTTSARVSLLLVPSSSDQCFHYVSCCLLIILPYNRQFTRSLVIGGQALHKGTKFCSFTKVTSSTRKYSTAQHMVDLFRQKDQQYEAYRYDWLLVFYTLLKLGYTLSEN